jgi:hypothetical protein
MKLSTTILLLALTITADAILDNGLMVIFNKGIHKFAASRSNGKSYRLRGSNSKIPLGFKLSRNHLKDESHQKIIMDDDFTPSVDDFN